MEYLKRNLDNGQRLKAHKKKLEELVIKYHQGFLDHDDDTTECKHGTLKIELKSNVLVFSKQFRVPEEHRKKIIEYADNAVRKKVLETAASRYNSPVFLVPKKGGK